MLWKISIGKVRSLLVLLWVVRAAACTAVA